MIGFNLVGLIVLALLIAAVVGLVRALRGPAKRVSEPSCGSCRYPVAGLETMRCPECGTDLREAGILTPGVHRGLPPALLRALMLAIFSFVFWIGYAIAEDRIDGRFGTWTSTDLATYQSSTATLPDIEATFDSTGSSLTLSRVALGIKRAGAPTCELVIDPATWQFSAQDRPAMSAAAVRPDDLADWIRRSGYGGDGETALEAGRELYESIVAKLGAPLGPFSATGPHYSGLMVTTTQSFLPDPWFDEIAISIGAVLWGAGCLLLWRVSHRRGQRPPASAA